MTARSICTPFSLLSDSHTLTHMTTILSTHLGLREMGTLSTTLSLETPFIPPGKAEKDIPDLPIGAGCREGQRQETPKEASRRVTPSGMGLRTREERPSRHREWKRVGGQGQEQEGPHPPCTPSLAHSRLESGRICLGESTRQLGPVMVEGTCTTAWESLLQISEESDSEQITEKLVHNHYGKNAKLKLSPKQSTHVYTVETRKTAQRDSAFLPTFNQK